MFAFRKDSIWKWQSHSIISKSTNGFTMSVGDQTIKQAKRKSEQDLESAAALAGFELRPADVICTKRRITRGHPGNMSYDSIIQKSRDRYQACQLRGDKTRITDEVITLIKNSGGRFVKYYAEAKMWTEISTALEREKVSHALRSSKSPMIKRRKQIQARPATPECTISNAAPEMNLKPNERLRIVYHVQQEILNRMRLESDNEISDSI